MIPKETIDEIFNTARVEEVIGDFVHLKKSGANYKAKSPFVDEKTPSFMVSPAKQIWKCFSSGKGGNVVSFLMEAEHMSYVEALKWLADKYNIEVKEDRERSPEEIQAQSVRENLSIINDFAKNQFVRNLTQNEEGKAIGLSYFRERGFREDIIKKFELGYSLDESAALTDAALAKGYNLEYLIKSGLTKSKDNRNFDFFRGRVMFPIHSIAGKVLGFGGRTLKTDKKVAKYFNSPESELYNKSKILYGLYFAKNAIIKYDNCFLVEGYTDVISMHQCGVENVVASSGTSLTEGQINLIKRYSDNITILYDGDAAGIKASFRGIDMILKEGLNVKVVLFPDGEDPDSYAQKHSASEVVEYIDQNAKDFIVFKSDVLLTESGNDPIKKAGLIRDIVTSISLIPDAIKQQVYIRESAAIFDMDETLLATELGKLKRQNLQKTYQSNQRSSTPTPNSAISSLSAEDIPLEAMIPPEYQTQTPVSKAVKETKKELFYQEVDLIRILLLYGTYSVTTTNIEVDEKGKEHEKEVEVSVMEFIRHELEKDDIELLFPPFQLIYQEYKDGLDDNTFYNQQHFTRHENSEITQIAIDILASQHELSPEWNKQNVRIKTEIDNLDRAVLESVYAYKVAKIKYDIKKIQHKIQNLNDDQFEDIVALLAEQNILEKVKMAFSEKLGRTII